MELSTCLLSLHPSKRKTSPQLDWQSFNHLENSKGQTFTITFYLQVKVIFYCPSPQIYFLTKYKNRKKNILFGEQRNFKPWVYVTETNVFLMRKSSRHSQPCLMVNNFISDFLLVPWLVQVSSLPTSISHTSGTFTNGYFQSWSRQ